MSAILAVVIPAYKCRAQIGGVISGIPGGVHQIIVIDDCCPEGTGKFVEAQFKDSRIKVLYHERNQGVGGAVMTGYCEAVESGASFIVKLDGDGQMDPKLIPNFVAPLENGRADYVKGNRFSRIEHLLAMPKMRLFGNLALSFISKASTGYWSLLDPTNGYTAIRAEIVRELPLAKIARRYFFESDLLFRLNLIGAVVKDVAMAAKYEDEISNLKIRMVLVEFSYKHLRNFLKRLVYRYFILDFNFGSLQLLAGFPIFCFGVLFGLKTWIHANQTQIAAPVGTVVLIALNIIIGFQLLLGFSNFDIQAEPRVQR